MPYYYYGYGDAAAQSIYLVVLIPVLLLSFWAQTQVNGNFKRYSRVMNARRVTGAQAAEMVLRAHGVRNVRIAGCSGTLSDHYDPRNNTIYLSNGVYDAATIAAVGVAAHEAGHAVQYAVGYFPIRVRAAIIPMTQFGSKFSFIALMLGLVMYSQQLLLAGIILFSLTTLFQLVTLPVEFNASARALETLEGEYILETDELSGAKKVLRAAALTYVASLLMSLVQLLRYVLIFAGRSNRRGGNR
ncbi:MAG: zinc metallopeptidase [Oscillospiraceae bacterium]|nr:zinc metallopeptidase [Oscillospiraceae bacterium]